MLLTKWLDERHSEWWRKCEACDIAETLHALISEFSTEGINWELASQVSLFKRVSRMHANMSTNVEKCVGFYE